MLKVAIIGAGLSGMVLANDLSQNFDVKIFEKSRGVGGRMSTRYAENFVFDHGLQYFTAQSLKFLNFVKANGAEPWQGEVLNLSNGKSRQENYLVATPNMSGLCKSLIGDLQISLNTEVVPLLEKQADGWHLFDKNSNALGVFDLVISTAPLLQTLNLFGKNAEIKNVQALPCFALMIGFADKEISPNWIFAEVENSPIKSIALNSSKPKRSKDVTCFVVQSSNDWALKNLESEVSEVQKELLKEFEKLTAIDCSKANYVSTHRWRYSVVLEEKQSESFLDLNLGLAATGDWVSNSQLEEVWGVAKKLAGEILDHSCK
ncbi:MAG: NAD(P)-binding protein [Rickettsiales bacterium]|nr:NAD(P)-binding protein [Rickettsiales bacterium]